jgi:hypothetical protein
MRARTTLWAAFACQAACQRQYEPGTPWIIAAGSAPEGDADEGDGAEADDGVGSDVDGGADPAGGEPTCVIAPAGSFRSPDHVTMREAIRDLRVHFDALADRGPGYDRVLISRPSS